MQSSNSPHFHNQMYYECSEKINLMVDTGLEKLVVNPKPEWLLQVDVSQ